MFPKQNINNNPLQNYQLQVNNKQPRSANVVKTDWNVNDNTRAYVRYTFDGGTQEDRSTGANWGNLEGFTKRPRPDRALAANFTQTFSPTMVVEALYSWNYDQVRMAARRPRRQHQDALRPERAADRLQAGRTTFCLRSPTPATPISRSRRMPAIAINNEHQFSGA